MHYVNILFYNHERKHHETTSNRRRRRRTETTSIAKRFKEEEIEMNGWRSRLALLAILLVAPNLHLAAWAFIGKSLTDEGMALFHGSAAAVDFFILWCAPRFIAGRLCDDIQTLCIVSVVANYVGWIAYTAYAPPIFYNTFMWGLSYVHWARLLLVDSHADTTGLDLVRCISGGRYQENFRKAYP